MGEYWGVRVATTQRLAAAIGMVIVSWCGQSNAMSSEEAQQLLARAFENLYADDYVQKIELTSRTPGVRPISRILQITRSQSERPSKALIRFLEPYDIRGTSVLVIGNRSRSDELFVFLPAIGITRRLSAAQRRDAFFGTDLTYEDVEPKDARNYDVSWVGSANDETSCNTIDIRPKDGIESGYDRMRSCIEESSGIIHWTEFFRNGEFVKRLESDLETVHVVGTKRIPFVLRIDRVGSGSETTVRTISYEMVPRIPGSLFSTWNLEAGDAARDRSKMKLHE